MRKYASAEERAAKNQKTTVRHFGFTEKVYGLPYTVRTMWKRHHRNAIVRISFFGGAEGAPILFSEIGFCVASCSYICIYLSRWRRRGVR